MPVHCICKKCEKHFKICQAHKDRGGGIFCSIKCSNTFPRPPRCQLTVEEFLSKVDRFGECWIWTGTKDRNGYGRFTRRINGTPSAHRISWMIFRGPIPEGLFVLHDCPDGKDNPSCVNPDHLWLGTNQDNLKDRNNKKRHAHGERSGTAKLTEENVIDIRKLHDIDHLTDLDIAKRFKVSKAAIHYVVKRKSWKHVNEKPAAGNESIVQDSSASSSIGD